MILVFYFFISQFKLTLNVISSSDTPHLSLILVLLQMINISVPYEKLLKNIGKKGYCNANNYKENMQNNLQNGKIKSLPNNIRRNSIAKASSTVSK